MNLYGTPADIPKLNPGDTLYLRDGLYTDPLPDVPRGDSWDSAVTIAAVPGGRVTLRPKGLRVLDLLNTRYIEFRGLTLDAVNCTSDCVQIGPTSFDGDHGKIVGPSHHIRLRSCEIMRSRQQGVLIVPECHCNELIDCRIHHNGSEALTHGVYCESWHNRVEGCDVYENSGWGIHVYNGYQFWHTAINLILGNRCWHNGLLAGDGCGIGLYSGNDNEARYNECWGNAVGITVNYGATDTVVANNRAWGNTAIDYYSGDGAADTIETDNHWG